MSGKLGVMFIGQKFALGVEERRDRAVIHAVKGQLGIRLSNPLLVCCWG